MKNARLIKKETIQSQASSSSRPATQGTSLKQAVNVVKEWVQGRHTTQQQHARQVFASLFAQPQS